MLRTVFVKLIRLTSLAILIRFGLDVTEMWSSVGSFIQRIQYINANLEGNLVNHFQVAKTAKENNPVR